MRILCTFPGRYGDLLWALPSIRALSEAVDAPIDLAIAGEFAGIIPLLDAQSYLGTIRPLSSWALEPPESWRAPLSADQHASYDQVIDLGYRGWPTGDLARNTERLLQGYSGYADLRIDLRRLWVGLPRVHRLEPHLPAQPRTIAIGFTEAWFELKLGILFAAFDGLLDYQLLTIPDSRWMTEGWGIDRVPCDWVTAARAIAGADLFVGDCSALHVLAAALGTPALIVEPMEGRWNPIFYPLGMDGPQVTVIRGNDGRPTYDARAVRTAVDLALGVLRA